MESGYNTPHSVGNDLKVMEADLLEDLGVEGLNFLKKMRKKGSLEKLLESKGGAGLTLTQLYGKNQMKSWAKCKKVAQSSAQDDCCNGDKVAAYGSKTADRKGGRKVKLVQTWADRMEVLEAMLESTTTINKSAATTSNSNVHDYEEGSSSHNGRDCSKEAIATFNGDVHGAVRKISAGEDDQRHWDISNKHMGGQQAQVKGSDRFTIIGNIKSGLANAMSLNGLIAQGLVVSGAPDGVIAVHGNQCDSQGQIKGPHELACTRSCEKQRAEPRDGNKNLMRAEQKGEAQMGQEYGPLEGSKVSPKGTTGTKLRLLFGGHIRSECDRHGLGFSVLAGPTAMNEASKEAIVFGPSEKPDVNRMNNLEGSVSDIQFGTIPMNRGSERRWDDRLRTNARGKSKLSFIPPSIVNGRPVIHVKSDQFEHMHQDYKNSLIGSFIGKKSTFEYVNEITSSEWKTKNYTMRPYGEFSFCFDFKDPNERRAALEMGSLHIASQLFYIQEWKPFIEAELKELKTIPVWVMFHNFPEELRNEKGYSQVASAIGQPLFVDKRTERKETSYARICVEVDTDCAYLETVQINIDGLREFKLQTEYKWKPPVCKNCKVFGHTQCTKNGNQTKNKGKRAEVLVWKVKQTKTKEATKENQKQKCKDVEKNKEEWSTPTKKHSFKGRRVQTNKGNEEGTSTPTFTSVFECLRTSSEERMEEEPDNTDPAGANIT